LFVVEEGKVEKHKKELFDYEVPDVIAEAVRTKWTDPLEREIDQVCAQHKAELMHTDVTVPSDEDTVKLFDYKGYAVQVAAWCNEKVEDIKEWVTSEWIAPKDQKKKDVCAAANVENPELPCGMWMLDTGSGHDLVNKDMAEGYETKRLNKPLIFSTAGGQTQSYCTVPMYSQAMGGHIEPYLLPQTPPVLSIGKRCMEEGYEFHWEAR
jgi:hypothetical protein